MSCIFLSVIHLKNASAFLRSSEILRRSIAINIGGVRRRASSVLRLSQELLGQSWPNLVCSIRRVRGQDILYFMTPNPRGDNFGVKGVKLMHFSKNLLFYSQAWTRQTKIIVMMTKEGSAKFVNFMNAGAVVLVLGCGHISQVVKRHCFFKILLLYF